MLKSKRPDPDPDRNKPMQPRTGHGTASVIARLNEQTFRVEPGELEEPADPPASSPSINATPLPS